MISNIKRITLIKSLFVLFCLFVILNKISCLSEKFTLNPNSPFKISNPLLWGISASCKVTTSDPSDEMSGRMTKGTGKINGQNVGSGVELTVKSGDTFSISASGLAGVEITNHGQDPVIAECSLN